MLSRGVGVPERGRGDGDRAGLGGENRDAVAVANQRFHSDAHTVQSRQHAGLSGGTEGKSDRGDAPVGGRGPPRLRLRALSKCGRDLGQLPLCRRAPSQTALPQARGRGESPSPRPWGLCPGSTSNPRWSPRPLGKCPEGTQTPGAAMQNGESARGPDRAEPAWTYLGHHATFTRTAQWSGRARSRRCARMAGGLVLGPGTRLGPILASFRTQRCTSSRAPPATGGPARSRIPLCPGAWPGAPSCTVVVGCVALCASRRVGACCRGPAAEPCVHAGCRRVGSAPAVHGPAVSTPALGQSPASPSSRRLLGRGPGLCCPPRW